MTESVSSESVTPEAPVADGMQSSPAPISSDKRKIKIDGVETEVDINEVLKDYNKYKAADKRFEEASKLRKEAEGAFADRKQIEALIENATKGELSWLKQIVPKEMLKEWAEKELLEHIEWESMPEAERRAIMAEHRAQEAEDRINEITQTKERENATRLEEQAYGDIENEIIAAVKDRGYDIKITPRFIRRISEQMLASLEASTQDPNVKLMPAKVASDRALRGLKVDAQELLSLLPAEEVLKMLPPKIREAIRKADVEQAMSQMPRGVRQESLSIDEVPQRKPKLKRMSTDEYFDRLEKSADKRWG